jgi:phage shock protein C
MTDDLHRDKSKGMLGGVCAGLAEYFAVSPILLRLMFVLWILASPTSAIAYMVLWIILPEKEAVRLSRGEALRQNVSEIQSEAREWGRDLRDVFSGETQTRTVQTKRIVLLGGLFVVMGLTSLVDSLHLLGWFRLDQLGAPVLILMGFASVNRALRR